jgi:hypothetical protein
VSESPRFHIFLTALATLALAVAVAVSTATAHVERPSYWPDPAPDRSVNPPAGGKVPDARSLYTALRKSPPGATRVVCQGRVPSTKRVRKIRRSLRKARRRKASTAKRRSIKRKLRRAKRRYRRAVRRNTSVRQARESAANARSRGHEIRPSVGPQKISSRSAKRLTRFNERLLARCRYHDIQTAVNRSQNNDRVVIMPGVYTEPKQRAKKTFDPACDKYEVRGDPPTRTGAASYAYQWHCPNDQNLIAVMGRELRKGKDPDPPRWDRHGIPNTGRCIRCNLQIEGSGVGPDDVVIEAGKASAGNGGPSGVGAAKDVGIRADRADGFVFRNIKVRHAKEHGIYVLETDGYLLDRFEAYYNGLYGTLTFVDDHGVQQNCNGVGHGDSALYPGAPVETGEQRPPNKPFRYNQEVRFCDASHNLAGYSATNGNAVRVHHNDFYGNALGFNTDVATSPGHPGFPGDSMLIEHNEFYSNNFNLFAKDSDVEAAFPYPVGTGLWIAGGNNHTVRFNHFYDNWRRGAMVLAVPNQLVCGPAAENEQAGCDPNGQATSNRNRFYGNVMGRAPDGRRLPNGTDFWWDQFAGNRANCWYQNSGPKPITSDPPPPLLPDCANGSNPDSSVGTGNPVNEAELANCAIPFITGNLDPNHPCPWFDSPERPGSQAARRQAREQRQAVLEGREAWCREFESSPACS